MFTQCKFYCKYFLFLECDSIPAYDKTLPAVVATNVSREGKLITGSSLSFSCQPNYGLINSISTCGLDGKWTPEIICVRGNLHLHENTNFKTTQRFFFCKIAEILMRLTTDLLKSTKSRTSIPKEKRNSTAAGTRTRRLTLATRSTRPFPEAKWC